MFGINCNEYELDENTANSVQSSRRLQIKAVKIDMSTIERKKEIEERVWEVEKEWWLNTCVYRANRSAFHNIDNDIG